MGKKQKSKARLDKYYYLAKEHGYRSRAAFKIIQLNKKYGFFQNSNVLIDLCAAPGGWLQAASKYMPISSIKIGVDLVIIKPIQGCTTLQADITSEKCRFLLKKELKHFKADIVMNDGAPNIGGTWVKDAFNQSELVLHSIKLATEFLKEGGWFITKVFRSSDYNSLLYVLKKLFSQVEATKPLASRTESAEIFVVCSGYKYPSIIDSKLLDPKFALKQIEDEEDMKMNSIQSIKALFNVQEKRHRTGYYGNLYKQRTMKEFIECNNPYQFIYDTNKIIITENCNLYMNKIKNPTKTNELLAICEDLKVLGKSEVQTLIIFRNKIRQHFLKTSKKIDEDDNNINYEEERNKNIDKEINENLKNKKRKDEVALKKKEKNELKHKMLFINDNNISNDEDVFDQVLFNFLQKNKIDIEDINPDIIKKKKKEIQIEDIIELSDLSEDDLIEKMNTDIQNNMRIHNETKSKKKTGKKKSIKEISDSENSIKSDDEIINDTNELVPNDKIFKNPLSNRVDNNIIHGKINRPDKLDCSNLSSDTEKSENLYIENKKFKKKFEISDDNRIESSSDYDTDDKAEIRAIAKKMLRKKNRINFLNSSYNKYSFEELENAPDWFIEEEKRHNQINIPITKEEVLMEKEQLRQINNRIPKKVLEAKNRKKRRLEKRLQKIKNQAQIISNQEEINEISKIKQIEKLYKKEFRKNKENKQYIFSRSSKKIGNIRSRKVKFVDRRLKKDKRAQKLRLKKNK